MRNKKTWFSVFGVIISLCVGIFPLTVSAAEASASYTFEQLLDMDEDEIVSISDECALAYEEAESAYPLLTDANSNAAPIHIVLLDESSYISTGNAATASVDSEKVLEALKLPEEMIVSISKAGDMVIDDGTYSDYIIELKLSSDGYRGYDMSDVYIRTYIALILSPEILYTELELPAVVSDGTETTETSVIPETTTDTTADAAQSETASTDAAAETENTLATNDSTLASETTAVTQTTTSATQSKSSSPATGDKGVALALGIAFLSIGSCILLKKQ